jgi:hypothetical protein
MCPYAQIIISMRIKVADAEVDQRRGSTRMRIAALNYNTKSNYELSGPGRRVIKLG